MKFLKEKLLTERNIGSLIFIFAAILSYSHTLEMFNRSHYKGLFAHIGTLACEALFLMGLIAINRARRAGEPTSRQARTAFILGGLIVLYSNVTSGIATNGRPLVFFHIRGIAINEVVMIGVLIPCIVFVSEMVVSYSHITQNATTTTPATTEPTEIVENVVKPALTHDEDIEAVEVEDVKEPPAPPIEKVVEPPQVDEVDEMIMEVAKELHKENGRLPGRKRLATRAKVSEYRADKVLKMLKEQAS